jgi:hypothetical protein
MLAAEEEATARGTKAGAGEEVDHVVDHATLFTEEAAGDDPQIVVVVSQALRNT